MGDYEAFDGDDTFMVISDGIESVVKCTKRIRSKTASLETRDSQALRKQIEDEHRRGQDEIAEVKAELRSASGPSISSARAEFREVCADFREAFAEYKRILEAPRVDSGESYYATSKPYGSGENASQQSLQLVFESDDVDAIMDQENREDAVRLAKDTATIRETMQDIHGLIEEGGETIMDIDQEIEGAAEAVDDAAEQLHKAREHQKSSLKLKIGIAVCCGVVLLVGLMILLWQLGVFSGK
mmetsp:Transcript_25660/g.37780  ORF Transcript_25660/g.37780 Transcript_25660/m.37780 type:complete len:242 (+) Transcript_25660:100-825(+)|eukprot:CAMPEP_0195525608 /NCGR_PEP_ID=MMETSP0794_2-20130614/26112_1 /TAXON_ID=515487 /ORGANISM="Stephanopyxis turris, Strain CCMP 815" /LENGTH=241 /DNA_ID=CAMNT_0040656097 /DNA_START=99 /DNA_END=824 /DNA_ORIENTATION=+